MNILPDFLIIGAMKCGTSALFHTITDHPKVAKTKKEKRFFNLHFDKGLEHYSNMFVPEMINCDATPEYLACANVPERVYQTVPDVKLIVSFRNPVDRTYSQYNHHKPKLAAGGTFEQELAPSFDRSATYLTQTHGYILRSRYAEQMRRWLQFFPLDQFCIINFENFKDNNVKTIKRVEDFLELENTGSSPMPRFKEYPPMAEETRRRLEEYFAPLNEELYELIGEDYGW